MRAILLIAAAALTLSAANPKIDEAKAKIKAGKYDEAIATLEAAEKAAPKDAEVRKALGDAHLAYGDSFMSNDQLPPFRKYPSALREYRKVLVYDKDNKQAQKNIATIEGVYKSMGREVPK